LTTGEGNDDAERRPANADHHPHHHQQYQSAVEARPTNISYIGASSQIHTSFDSHTHTHTF